jgi:hypothetical protein
MPLMKSTRPLVVVLLMAVAAGAGHAQDPPAAQPPGQEREKHPQIAKLEQAIAGKENLPAEQVFKNIQTFTGMPASRVLAIMEQAFVPNLGVNCSHCHTPGQWELDDKNPKKIARNMWAMRAEWQEEVRKASGNEKAVVTCYTCHKGQAKPAFAPAK